jgi:sensor histidine kinase YesM
MIDFVRNILYNDSTIGVFAPFMMGILLIISIQNIFFYVNYKDKSYLWYATYAFTIMADQVIVVFGEAIGNYFNVSTDFLYGSVHPGIQWLYNAAYGVFVLEFGGVFLAAKKTARTIKRIIYTSVVLMTLIFIVDLFYKGAYVGLFFFYVQLPVFLIIAIFVYRILFQIKSKVKYFIIPGSLVYTIFALIATAYSMYGENGYIGGWIIFYIGIFIENIFFSLGLIVKQKIIIKERNRSQEALIVQLNKNEELKSKLNKQLQEEVKKKKSENIELIKKAEKEKIKQLQANYEKKIAELKISSLQSQMNPHFIFNSLNSINLYIIKNDTETAVNYINKFSKLIRKILAASREKEVTLKEELETVELYANIENIRFKNEIDFRLAIEKDLNLTNIKIPPLILQPFIENAIWHGLSTKKGAKKLEVEVSKLNEDHIRIEITDNGIGRKKSTELKNKKVYKKTSIGIKLTKERLQTFSKKYQTQYNLSFIDLELKGKSNGTKVIIDLPINA